MSEIVIGANSYDVYQDVEEIDIYAAAMIGDAGDGWRAADADTQARAGVTATRIIDRLAWAGSKADEYQAHAWPRKDLTYPDGQPVDPGVIPTELLEADCEIAAALAAGLDVQPDPNTEATRMLKANGVQIEYFRTIIGTTIPLPLSVMQLVGFWLGGSTGVIGSESFGTCEKTAFDRQYNVNTPF